MKWWKPTKTWQWALVAVGSVSALAGTTAGIVVGVTQNSSSKKGSNTPGTDTNSESNPTTRTPNNNNNGGNTTNHNGGGKTHSTKPKDNGLGDNPVDLAALITELKKTNPLTDKALRDALKKAGVKVTDGKTHGTSKNAVQVGDQYGDFQKFIDGFNRLTKEQLDKFKGAKTVEDYIAFGNAVFGEDPKFHIGEQWGIIFANPTATPKIKDHSK